MQISAINTFDDQKRVTHGEEVKSGAVVNDMEKSGEYNIQCCGKIFNKRRTILRHFKCKKHSQKNYPQIKFKLNSI